MKYRLLVWYQYAVYMILSNFLRLKFWALSDYYGRLAVQARYLYFQSELFKMRWQEIGLDYAENSFEGQATYFFWKAKQSPWVIKRQIILDSILGRPARPYTLSNSGT